jgi:hypothetical protein
VGGVAAHTPKNSVLFPFDTEEPYFFVPLRVRLSCGVFPRDRGEKSLPKKQECQLKGIMDIYKPDFVSYQPDIGLHNRCPISGWA